jgi:hypothetical protein
VLNVVRWVAVHVSRVTSTLEKSIAAGGTGERRTQSKGGGEERLGNWAERGGTAGKREDKGGGGSFF